MTNDELRIADCELRIADCELRIRWAAGNSGRCGVVAAANAHDLFFLTTYTLRLIPPS